MGDWLPTPKGNTLHFLPEDADRTMCGTYLESLDPERNVSHWNAEERKCRTCQKSGGDSEAMIG